MAQTIVFIDLETAGTNPERHPIIQVAALAADETLSPLEAYEAKVRFHPHTANRYSLRKNHYHPGIWSLEAKEPKTVAQELADFLRRHASVAKLSARGDSYRVAQLVAHHAAFDAAFLRCWYDRLGLYLPASPLVLCTLQRALWYFAEHPELTRPKDMKLATLCKYFGVNLHAAAAHEALADVAATLALYQALTQTCSNDNRSTAARRTEFNGVTSSTSEASAV